MMKTLNNLGARLNSKNKSLGISTSLTTLLVLLVAGAVLAALLSNFTGTRRELCLVSSGDVVCFDDKLDQVSKNDFPQTNGKATAISASPDKSYFIVDDDNQYRDAPLSLYDKDMVYQGPIELPVTAYDIQKIQWAKNSTTAYVLSDIGVLHAFNPSNKSLTQLTDSRALMKPDEQFDANKRGFIHEYALVNDRLVLSVEGIDTVESSDGLGLMSFIRLYSMKLDGTDIKQLTNEDRIMDVVVDSRNRVLFSVERGDPLIHAFYDEENELYRINVDGSGLTQLAGEGLRFRDFAYDPQTDSVFLARGPGGSIFEVFYNKQDKLSAGAKKIKLAESASMQGSRSIVPFGSDKLAIVSPPSSTEWGTVQVFELKTGKRVSILDHPAITITGVESIFAD